MKQKLLAYLVLVVSGIALAYVLVIPASRDSEKPWYAGTELSAAPYVKLRIGDGAFVPEDAILMDSRTLYLSANDTAGFLQLSPIRDGSVLTISGGNTIEIDFDAETVLLNGEPLEWYAPAVFNENPYLPLYDTAWYMGVRLEADEATGTVFYDGSMAAAEDEG